VCKKLSFRVQKESSDICQCKENLPKSSSNQPNGHTVELVKNDQ